MVRRAVALSIALAVGACVEAPPNENEGVPGELLGTYQVRAVLQDTTCGSGGLEAPPSWDFTIRLSRQGQTLFWNNGEESIPGELAADGVSFAMVTEIAVPVRAASARRKPCVMRRSDLASGTLLADGEQIAGFKGALAYGFKVQDGSDCSEDVLEAGIETLPCQIEYTMEAARQP